jgi:hypothetical protein
VLFQEIHIPLQHNVKTKMRIILSLIFVLALIAAFFALPVRFRKMIQRRIDHVIAESMFKQLSFLATVTGLSFGILLIFMLLVHGDIKLKVTDWLLSFINPGNFFANSEELDDSERAWAIISGITGIIFMSGLLISVISNIMERRVDTIRNGKAYYDFKNHVVVIGYDRMSVGLIRQLAKDKRYSKSEIVLQTTQEVPRVRHELFSRLESAIEKKVTIISGNRTSIEDLRRLHINLCKEVFILGEKGEYDNDSLDVECLHRIHRVFPEKSAGKIIRCNVRFECQTTFAVFQRQDIDRLKDRINFIPFNYDEMWAQKVFVEGEYESPEQGGQSEKVEYTPLDREGINAGSDKKVHLVVIGMSGMGIAIGIQAARLCHFPNFITKGIKTRITFIDENADMEMNLMRGRYRQLFDETDIYYSEIDHSDRLNSSGMKKEATKINPRKATEIFTDIEFEFIKASVECPAIQNYLVDLSYESHTYLTVAVCFSFPPQALATGFYLPDELYDNHIPIVVQQEIPYCTLDMQTKGGKYKNVKPFGMFENGYNLSKADDRIPMMVNYVYSTGIPEKFPEEEIVAMWHDLRTALKWSNRYHADSIQFKIRSFADCLDEPLNDQQIDLMARVEHNRWNMEKLLMGYRTTTPLEKEAIAKDPSKKNEYKINRFAHHDICAYDDLQSDETGINAREYDCRISSSLPLIIRADKRLREYFCKTSQNKPTL